MIYGVAQRTGISTDDACGTNERSAEEYDIIHQTTLTELTHVQQQQEVGRKRSNFPNNKLGLGKNLLYLNMHMHTGKNYIIGYQLVKPWPA